MSQASMTRTTDIYPMDVTQQAEAPAGPSHADVPAPEPFLIIRPTRGWGRPQLARGVAVSAICCLPSRGRDLKLRYKQTALGVIWVVLQPLMAAGIFSFVFGKVAKLPSDGVAVPALFVCRVAGVEPVWQHADQDECLPDGETRS